MSRVWQALTGIVGSETSEPSMDVSRPPASGWPPDRERCGDCRSACRRNRDFGKALMKLCGSPHLQEELKQAAGYRRRRRALC